MDLIFYKLKKAQRCGRGGHGCCGRSSGCRGRCRKKNPGAPLGQYKLHTFVGTESLRAGGIPWSSDPSDCHHNSFPYFYHAHIIKEQSFRSCS